VGYKLEAQQDGTGPTDDSLLKHGQTGKKHEFAIEGMSENNASESVRLRNEKTDTGSVDPEGMLQAFLVLGAVAGAIILFGRLFGLSAGTSLLAAVVGFVFGIFGGLNRRGRW
jgi:hypothetical protein